MPDPEIVRTITVTRKVYIRRWDADDGAMFDWTDDTGDQSNEWFDSVDEAERDAR